MRFNYEKFRIDRSRFYSQAELAAITGISENTIKNMESGRKTVRKGNEELIVLCDLLGLNIEDYWLRDLKKICLYNFKGGVTKTSSTCCIADVLANEYGKRVLLIDIDPQASLTQNLNMHLISNYDEKNIYQAFIKQEPVTNGYIHSTSNPNVDIVVSHLDLSLLEPILPNLPYREDRLYNILEPIITLNEYDYVLVDTAPSMTVLNSIVLRSMDYLIVPVVCDPFSLTGLGTVLQMIEQMNEDNKIARVKSRLKLLGVLISKYDKRITMSMAIHEVLQKLYKDYLFSTIIPTDVSITKAQGDREMLSTKHSKSNAYAAYTELAKEILHATKEQ